MVRILHLVLYSRDIYYDKMKTITEIFYKKFINVDTYYYLFDDNLDGIYNNCVYIKGKETFIPGILMKTIKTFEKFNNDFEKYDYVVRSNISTIVNFTLLTKYLENNNIMCGGGLVHNLQWLHHSFGIIDKTHFGTHFVSGACIIFNKEVVKKILQNKILLDFSIIDDVALGVLIKELNINITEIALLHSNEKVTNNEGSAFGITNIGHFNFCGKNFRNVSNNIMFYRNKNNDRQDDINNLKFITENI